MCKYLGFMNTFSVLCENIFCVLFKHFLCFVYKLSVIIFIHVWVKIQSFYLPSISWINFWCQKSWPLFVILVATLLQHFLSLKITPYFIFHWEHIEIKQNYHRYFIMNMQKLCCLFHIFNLIIRRCIRYSSNHLFEYNSWLLRLIGWFQKLINHNWFIHRYTTRLVYLFKVFPYFLVR